MLHAPELKPGDIPFDPDIHYRMHSKIRPTDHYLKINGGNRADPSGDALLWGAGGPAERESAGEPANRELEAIKKRNAAFDDAHLRSVLTDMHERGDAFEESLEKLSGREVGDIIKRTETFLKNQWKDLQGRLTSDRQRRFFESAFASFRDTTYSRARALQEHKTRLYQAEVTERQNKVFLEQALRPENLFNDELQTVYRDMCLLNLDNLHPELPERERTGKLDAASAEFCRRILDKRLELDPARMRRMLDAPAVRRVLGTELLERYESRAAEAARNEAIRENARQWAEAEMNPADAGKKAAAMYRDAAEREAALKFYREFREPESRLEAARNLTEIDAAWREITREKNGASRSLNAVRHSDPELAVRLEEALASHRRSGGVPARPDYPFLLRLTDAFDPFDAAEELRDRLRAVEVYIRLGGPEAQELGLYLRMFQGTARSDDQALLEALRLARDCALAKREETVSIDEMKRYLGLFIENMRLFMKKNESGALELSERTELVRKTMEGMKWTDGDASPDIESDKGSVVVSSGGDTPGDEIKRSEHPNTSV